jgi:hypothetical protein
MKTSPRQAIPSVSFWSPGSNTGGRIVSCVVAALAPVMCNVSLSPSPRQLRPAPFCCNQRAFCSGTSTLKRSSGFMEDRERIVGLG